MKDKGFTLIELLAVIAIIGTLGVIVTISLTKTLEDDYQKNCEAFVKELEDAACVYAELHKEECSRDNCPSIRVDTLIKEGLLKSETDACTNKDIDLDEVVEVTWDIDGEKHCEYKGIREYER